MWRWQSRRQPIPPPRGFRAAWAALKICPGIVLSVSAQSFRSDATTAAQPAEVWKALQRPETWGTIGGVRRVEAATYDDANNLMGYEFVVEIAGTEHRGVATRSSAKPDREMVMDIDSPQVTGQIQVTLASDDVGTLVRVSMTMSPTGFLSSLVFPVITRAVVAGFDETVASFVEQLG